MDNHFFDTLPIHPQPEPFESHSSHVLRLVEDNRISSMKGLSVLFFPHKYHGYANQLLDYPPTSFGQLPTTAACSEAKLLATTFYHLGKKFGRLSKAQPLSRFLKHSVANYLRYCPLCLAEKRYYHLPWRFVTLQGCPTHSCELLKQCGHCNQEIPIFSRILKVGICPSCKKDLSACSVTPLTNEALESVILHSEDLEFLLSSQVLETDNNYVKAIGRELAQRRQARGLTKLELAQATGIILNRITGIELTDGRHRGVTFLDYVTYAKYFKITLKDLFYLALRQEESERLQSSDCQDSSLPEPYQSDKDEEIEKVWRAVDNLVSRNEPVTQHAILKLLGIYPRQLKKHPKVQATLKWVIEEYYRKCEEKWINDFGDAIAKLKFECRPVTKQTVCKMVGLKSLRKYPQAGIALDRMIEESNREIEESLCQQVVSAIQNLKTQKVRITQKAVLATAGVSNKALKKYPQVKLILQELIAANNETCTTTDYSSQARRFEDREQELIVKVQEAKMRLVSQGTHPTQSALCKIVGISAASLRRYPQVKKLLEEIVAARKHKLQPFWFNKVQEAIKMLNFQKKPITPEAVSEIVGLSLAGLREYPHIREILKGITRENILNNRNKREQILVEKVTKAIEILKLQEKHVTEKAVGKMIGLYPSSLKEYGRVREILEQAIEKRVSERKKQLQSLAEREKELVSQVHEAQKNLRAQGKPVTVQAVSQLVGMSPPGLRKYPLIKAILDSLVQENRRNKQSKEKPR